MKYFLDSSYIIALELLNDQNHKAAASHWKKLKKSSPEIITTSFIFGEVVTFFNNIKLHSKAVEIGNRLIQSTDINFVNVDRKLFNAGWKYFQKYSDKDYSMTDCISFVVMTKFDIKEALTFDKHFLQAGLIILP